MRCAGDGHCSRPPFFETIASVRHFPGTYGQRGAHVKRWMETKVRAFLAAVLPGCLEAFRHAVCRPRLKPHK